MNPSLAVTFERLKIYKKGLESQGMMLCADDQGLILLYPEKEILPGSMVK